MTYCGTFTTHAHVSRSAWRCVQPSVVQLEGSLRAPMTVDLSGRVEALLRCGQRRIVLDLARLADIDAAGIGELIHAFTMTNAAGGILKIARPNSRVRHLLGVAGVLGLLSAQAPAPLENTATSGAGPRTA